VKPRWPHSAPAVALHRGVRHGRCRLGQDQRRCLPGLAPAARPSPGCSLSSLGRFGHSGTLALQSRHQGLVCVTGDRLARDGGYLATISVQQSWGLDCTRYCTPYTWPTLAEHFPYSSGRIASRVSSRLFAIRRPAYPLLKGILDHHSSVVKGPQLCRRQYYRQSAIAWSSRTSPLLSAQLKTSDSGL
jgi:hypothetical protein